MIRKTILSIFLSTFGNIAYTAVTIDGTRIIFHSGAKSTNVQLRNGVNQPALVQTWIDNGNEMEIPKGETIPFILNPSLTRIEAQKGQIIRIIPTNVSTLATDRESLFWFNMLDIPPEDEALKDIDKIKFNVRTRIKLFYRPKNLKISPTKAYEELQFKLVNKNEIEVNNPTPYFITLTNIDDVNQQTNYLNKAVVLEPFDNKKINLNQDIKNHSFDYSVINDIGTSQKFNATFLTN
jgi:chaperone protein EcpD